MKAAYQPIMLLAQLCIVVFVGIMILLSYIPHRLSDNVTNNIRTIELSVVIQDSSAVIQEDHPAKTILSGLNKYASRHEGFIGHINLIPVPDLIPSELIPAPAIIDEDEDMEIKMSVVSYSPYEGNDTGIFISKDVIAGTEYSTDANTDTVLRVDYQEIQVKKKIDPEYPFVAKDEGKEGEIIVLVYIDSIGELSLFPEHIVGDIHTLQYVKNGQTTQFQYAAKEDPTGWYFIDNFLQVLTAWEFSPRIVDGTPVSAPLRIKYRFCLSLECQKYEIISIKLL